MKHTLKGYIRRLREHVALRIAPWLRPPPETFGTADAMNVRIVIRGDSTEMARAIRRAHRSLHHLSHGVGEGQPT